jgi:hypothetical protein
VRLAVLLPLAVGGVGAASAEEKAGATSRPPWQRLLKGDEAKHAAALEQELTALREKGAFAEAVGPAERLWRLRQRAQGKAHWETADARWLVKSAQAAARLPAAA